MLPPHAGRVAAHLLICGDSCVDNAHPPCQKESGLLFMGKPHRHPCLQGSFSETVSISNLGVAKTGPVVENSGSLVLEYVNGSACTTSDGRRTTYTTRIHLVCSRGSLVRRALAARRPGPWWLRVPLSLFPGWGSLLFILLQVGMWYKSRGQGPGGGGAFVSVLSQVQA